METVRVAVESRSTNKNGNPLIRCTIPGYGKYPIPLNLTPEQGEQLRDGKDDYEAVLVKGELKEGKSGDFPDNFWWNVAMFEGIVDERTMTMSQTQAEQNGSPPSPSQSVPTVYGAASSPSSEADNKEMVYRRQTGLNCASSLIAPLALDDDDDKFQRVVAMAERFVGYISTGKADGLVDALIQSGAHIVEVVEEEPEPTYVYPEPPKRITEEAFNTYVDRAGWAWSDIEQWLDGLDPVDWVKQEKGRSMRLALSACQDAAVEAGLVPPEDFRTQTE